MPWLTNLATIARRTGYPVVEVAGWKTRGHGEQPAVLGIVAHHTAGHNDRGVVVEGRPGLSGPLSQFWLEHTGRIHVVAAGKCYHNNPSTSPYHDNSHAIGIEAENDGSEPWPAVQLDAYRRLCAELCKAFDLPATRIKGHKEVQPGKPDPHSINMNDFRADVARIMSGEDDVTAKDIWTYEIPVSFGSKENPSWQAKSILVNSAERLRSIGAKLDEQQATLEAQGATIRELVGAVGKLAGGAPVNIDELMERIESAIEAVSVKLVVTGNDPTP